jgi:hypothetical protein
MLLRGLDQKVPGVGTQPRCDRGPWEIKDPIFYYFDFGSAEAGLCFGSGNF